MPPTRCLQLLPVSCRRHGQNTSTLPPKSPRPHETPTQNTNAPFYVFNNVAGDRLKAWWIKKVGTSVRMSHHMVFEFARVEILALSNFRSERTPDSDSNTPHPQLSRPDNSIPCPRTRSSSTRATSHYWHAYLRPPTVPPRPAQTVSQTHPIRSTEFKLYSDARISSVSPFSSFTAHIRFPCLSSMLISMLSSSLRQRLIHTGTCASTALMRGWKPSP